MIIQENNSRTKSKSYRSILWTYKMLRKFPDKRMGVATSNIELFAKRFKHVLECELFYRKTSTDFYIVSLSKFIEQK